MRRQCLLVFVLGALVTLGVAQPPAVAQPAPPCLVAVTAGGDGIEIAQLHNTLTLLGVTWVDINSLADAQSANANVIIDRYDADYNMSPADATTWLNSGRGYIQLGDWPDFFANGWVEVVNGTPIPITVADTSSPLAAGLDAAWTGRGFWAYDWSSDAVGWATDTSLPDVIHATYAATTYTRVATTATVGAGRAVYIGINVYGSAAGPNDLKLLANALSWAGACAAQAPEAIPALGGIGIALLALALAVVGVAVVTRLR